MVKAIIFDLDGTLIQTEVLKANSYAQAIHFLTQGTVSEQAVAAVFGNFVGLSRQEVVAGLYKEFQGQLEDRLGSKDPLAIQKRLIEKRLAVYHEILADSALISKHFCPFNLGLLNHMYQKAFKVVLATMSHRKEVDNIIGLMAIRDKLDFILTRDDVKEGKPNPEIYQKAKDLLKLAPKECLVIEDSVNGIRAGLSAGMHVLAVTNDITRRSVHESGLLQKELIVDELEGLIPTVEQLLED